MSLVLVLVALVVVGVVAGVAAGVVGGGLAPPARERPRARLDAPLGALAEDDVAALRLSTAVRGYRMDEVDAVLDRLRAELRARDAGAVRAAPVGEQATSAHGPHDAPLAPAPPADRPERG